MPTFPHALYLSFIHSLFIVAMIGLHSFFLFHLPLSEWQSFLSIAISPGQGYSTAISKQSVNDKH